MKIKSILIASLSILILAIGVLAQDKTDNFEGVWKLDASKSELDEKVRFTAMTMTVNQTNEALSIKKKAETDNDLPSNVQRIKVSSKDKRGEIYKLDGTETSSELDGEAEGEVKFKTETENEGKLILIKNINLNYMGNEINTTITETWELSSDGKTLIVNSKTETQRGEIVSKMVFDKVVPNEKGL